MLAGRRHLAGTRALIFLGFLWLTKKPSQFLFSFKVGFILKKCSGKSNLRSTGPNPSQYHAARRRILRHKGLMDAQQSTRASIHREEQAFDPALHGSIKRLSTFLWTGALGM
jgi:hypothetical protein